MSNANYTHIQAHGIASAFEPGFIYQAATVGLPHGPVLPVGSPYRVVDVNVELGGTTAGDFIVLGEALPPGCVVLRSSAAGDSSIEDPLAEASVILATAAIAPADPNVPTVQIGTDLLACTVAGAQPGVPGTDLNGGLVSTLVDVLVPKPAGPGVDADRPVFPVLRIDTAPAAPNLGGSVNIKIVIFCP